MPSLSWLLPPLEDFSLCQKNVEVPYNDFGFKCYLSYIFVKGLQGDDAGKHTAFVKKMDVTWV